MDDDFADFEEKPLPSNVRQSEVLPPLAPAKLSLAHRNGADDDDSQFDEHENHIPSDESDDSLSFNEQLSFDVDVKLTTPRPDGGAGSTEVSLPAIESVPPARPTASQPSTSPTQPDEFDDFTPAGQDSAQLHTGQGAPAETTLPQPTRTPSASAAVTFKSSHQADGPRTAAPQSSHLGSSKNVTFGPALLPGHLSPQYSAPALVQGRWSTELLSLPLFQHVQEQLHDLLAKAPAPSTDPDPVLPCARVLMESTQRPSVQSQSSPMRMEAATMTATEWAEVQANAEGSLRRETERVMLSMGLAQGEPLPTRSGVWPLRYGPVHDMWAGRVSIRRAGTHTVGGQVPRLTAAAGSGHSLSTTSAAEFTQARTAGPAAVAIPGISLLATPSDTARAPTAIAAATAATARAAAIADKLLQDFVASLPSPRALAPERPSRA